MILTETVFKGLYIIDVRRFEDARGLFADTFHRGEFQKDGLTVDWDQCSVSFNKNKGILRGLHYQLPPNEQTKLVRCSRGATFDVVVDLRKNSKTYLQWFGTELTQDNYRALYISPGFAHGFQTLADDTEIFYHIAGTYAPQCERGIRWNDSTFKIQWPLPSPILSEKDSTLPDFK